MTSSVSRLFEALHFAAVKHGSQTRKGADADPYITHVIAVARVLHEEAGVEDDELLLAAVLHDTLEDTATTHAELEARFGARVRALVEEVTDDKRLEKQERKRLQVLHAPDKSHDAALLKIADKLCNIRDVVHRPAQDWDMERRTGYVEHSRQVVMRLPIGSEAARRLRAIFEREADAAQAAFVAAGPR